MSGINTGILTNAHPISAERIKELEAEVLNVGGSFAYLDESNELCFTMHKGVDGIKELAWNNAYELTNAGSVLTKRAYKKTGLGTFVLDSTYTKSSLNASWTAGAIPIFEFDGSIEGRHVFGDESFAMVRVSDKFISAEELLGSVLSDYHGEDAWANGFGELTITSDLIDVVEEDDYRVCAVTIEGIPCIASFSADQDDVLAGTYFFVMTLVEGKEYYIKSISCLTVADAIYPTTTTERLYGDGQEFYTAAPSTLSFRSTAPLSEFQDVQINGQTIDPSNYTLEEGSTIVKLSHEYLKTLDVGSYELSVVSNSKTVKGGFIVAAPELNEYGFYYNHPYVAGIPAEDDDGQIYYEYVALVINDTTAWFSEEYNLASLVTPDGSKSPLFYIIENGSTLKLYDPYQSGDQEPLTLNIQDGNLVLDDVFVFESTSNHNFCSDGYNLYAFNGEGYAVSHVAMYGTGTKPIATNINNYPVTAVANFGYIGVHEVDGPAIIKLPEGITKISEQAFAEAIISELHIPTTLTEIEGAVFLDCTSLRRVYITDLSAWCKIDFVANPLDAVAYNRDLYLNGQLLTDLIVPADITEFNAGAFGSVAFESVHIHKGVTKINDPTRLGYLGKSITFEGTCAEWDAIDGTADINSAGGSSFVSSYVQCSDGRVVFKTVFGE